MINKLRKKFISLTMISLLILLLVIVLGMNLINYQSVVKDADFILSLISTNEGRFPEFDNGIGKPPGVISNELSMETPYESRFFTVIYTESGDLLQVETSRIASVSSSDAVIFSKEALEKQNTSGFIEEYRYSVTTENGKIRVTFLDCGRKFDTLEVFLFSSSGMALIGFIAVSLIISYFSDRIVKPIADSYEKQKQFITDAGHEMRTPLTIINANTDILEMEIGENESLTDIKQQAIKLSNLTNDLVKLSRMEESSDSIQLIEFPISDVITETISSFNAICLAEDKKLCAHIEPMISAKGNPQNIEQLTRILLDNALKYSPPASDIEIYLKKSAKNITFEVVNNTVSKINNSDLKNIFDRFYRMDSSRNSGLGGYGIGLSIAKAIVTAHGGKISATAKDENTFAITVILPL